ncbi:hypothetical protein P168DRAFT_300499 [Aspergillus campestris IBT 28561]|uniref:Uncharacterized protein n=1 Tax=Aspergillus campestris (strain IBT 28561) TaxID=1392248 RepID=A0A2I1CQ21_ASPC2|nr:hypothetical protein P168DRAFT_300499 [Aspergillus campestris IBT 28561]
MWILHGNVTERGDVGGGPGRGSMAGRARTFAGSGIVFTPGRTHNRSRSPRVGSLALGKPSEQGALAGQRPRPQHRGGDALGRLRPSGGRLTTNLELVRTRGI